MTGAGPNSGNRKAFKGCEKSVPCNVRDHSETVIASSHGDLAVVRSEPQRGRCGSSSGNVVDLHFEGRVSGVRGLHAV